MNLSPNPSPLPCSASVLMRELTSAYQAFHAYDARHLRTFRMTPAQADVVCQLGAAGELSCGELADMAMIPRGSLSAVLDRLEDRKLISRSPSRRDRRQMRVRLTKSGSEVFARVFPGRISRLAERFDQLDEGTRGSILEALRELRRIFEGNPSTRSR